MAKEPEGDALEARLAAVEARLDALDSPGGVGDEDRLTFYKDYLLRARQDAMQDKTVLTQITYLKVVVFAALFSLLRSPSSSIGLSILPLVLFSLDYLHRSRFNEIFDRWHYAADVIIPKIRALAGHEGDFLEERVSGRERQQDYTRSEGAVRTVMTSLGVVGTAPILGAYLAHAMSLNARQGAVISIIWCFLLLLVYVGLFVWQERYRHAHISPVVMPLVVVGTIGGLFFFGDTVVEWYWKALEMSATLEAVAN